MISIEELKDLNVKFIESVVPNLTKERIKGICTSFWLEHRSMAVFNISKNDFNQAKQHFYVCGRLDELSVSVYNNLIFRYASSERFSFVLLSDCQELIERYTQLSYKGDGKNFPDFEVEVEKGEPAVLCHAMFMAAKGDWDMFARDIDIMENKLFKLKKYQGVLMLELEFYKALYSRDKEAIEAAIYKHLEPKNHKKRNDDPILNQYISTPAAGFAKLAWMNGIEVEINNPLVPKELLPIKPLEKYDDVYDFFNWELP